MAEEVTNLTRDSRLHAIIETAVEGIISINKDGIIQSCNPAAEKIFMYSAKEVVGQNVKILMPAPYQQEHDGYIASYLSSGEAKIIGGGREVKGLRKDGSIFPMWLAVAEFQEGKQKYFTGFVRDLSAEKTYFEKISSYEHILEHSLNEIYIFDANTLKFIRVNQGARNNLQYSDEEILELTPIDLKPEYTPERFNNLIDPLRKLEVDKIEFRTIHRRKDGTDYPVEVHLELTEYESKQAFVAIILDITQREEAQEKARINQEQLAHMDRVSIFGEMAAGIAHELNQPLTAIGTYANAGKRRIDSDDLDRDKLKELFEKISASSLRAGDVISRLRMMLKPHDRQAEYIGINELIEDTIELVKTDTKAINFQFTINLEKKLPKVVADNIQIQQVLLNLIRNAIDATESGPKNEKIIEISSKLLSNENRIQISIKDTGSGIDANSVEHIFNPFFTTKEAGMGIGLSICKTIIHEHGGNIWFENNAGKGATFYFTLPTALNSNE